MEIETFRRNVLKTVAIKPIKLGMRHASKNSMRAVTAKYALAIRHDVGNLTAAMGPYVLGLQFSPELKQAAFNAMGDLAADLIVLARYLKVKVPKATKKSRLMGTRTAALVYMDRLSNDLLGLGFDAVFNAPRTVFVKKPVVMPNKGGVKEIRDVEVVDQESEQAQQHDREEAMRGLLGTMIDLYWRLCHNMFEKTPADVLDGKAERLKVEYQDLKLFEQDAPLAKTA